jgi:hypothetical protein
LILREGSIDPANANVTMSNTVSAPLETCNGNGNDEAQISSAAPVQIYATTDTKLVSDFWAGTSLVTLVA